VLDELNWGRSGHATRKRMKHPCNLLANIIRPAGPPARMKPLPDPQGSREMPRLASAPGRRAAVLSSRPGLSATYAVALDSCGRHLRNGLAD